MNKEEQREADIDAMAEVLYAAVYGNDAWDSAVKAGEAGWDLAYMKVNDYRLMAENLLASSWLDEKLDAAESIGYDRGYSDGRYWND